MYSLSSYRNLRAVTLSSSINSSRPECADTTKYVESKSKVPNENCCCPSLCSTFLEQDCNNCTECQWDLPQNVCQRTPNSQ